MENVLTGVRVLDFSRYAAGPYCGMLLADMGADVIKIEKPGGEMDRELGPMAPDGSIMSTVMFLGRNRKGITLDITKEKGAELLYRLVEKSDMVLHNFVCGSKQEKMLHYDNLKEKNPKIIVVSVTGFGNTGPYANRPCFDSIAQALSGAMSYTGMPGSPPTRAGAAYADFSTGAHAAVGAVMALYYKEKTGSGQMVDTALFDVASSLVAGLGCAAEYKLMGYVRKQLGNHSFYNLTDSFETKDGWVMMSVIGKGLWDRFADAVGREDLKDDPRFKDDMSRFQHRHILQPIIADWAKDKTKKEVVAALEKARVPCGPINDIAEMVEDEQLDARQMLVDIPYPGIGNVPCAATPIKMSRTPGRIRSRAPEAGEHNAAVYSDLLDIDQETLRKLEKSQVV